jgi:cytochrome b6-f complex iron-sulfur subunit
VTALSAICSHLPCALDWKPAEGVLLCPCHQRTFTRDGRSADSAYPLPPLPPVQARVVADRVELLGT